MLAPRAARWLLPLVASGFAGAATAIVSLGSLLTGAPAHQLEIAMAASSPGVLQVFYDRGHGIAATDSAAVPIVASPVPIPVRVPLPAASYRLFRIDPNDQPGRYTIAWVRIVDLNGTIESEARLADLEPAWQTAIAARDDGHVTFVTPEAASDPQILWKPAAPIVLLPPSSSVVRALTLALAFAAPLFVVLLAADRWLSRRTSPANAAWNATARHGDARWVVMAAVVGALVATGPLFFGESLVSPNNGGAALLYDRPPFVFGSADTIIEDARGTDVGAMMWQNLPYTVIQRAALADGDAPLWNRYNAIGRPLWGQGQTHILDPVHLLSLAIPDRALAMDLRFVAARMIFAVGIGLVALAATGSRSGSMLAAIAASFVGYYTARLNHPAYFSLTYAPWVLLAYARLARATTAAGRGTAAAALAAASWLQLVASTPKEGIVVLVAMHLAGLCGLLLGREPWRDRLARLDSVALAGVAAVLASAPHWLIFLQTLSRSTTVYDVPAAHLAGWRHLSGFVLGAAVPGQPFASANTLVAAGVMLALVAWRRLADAPLIGGSLLTAAGLWAVAFGMVPASLLIKVPLLGNIHQIDYAFPAAAVPLALVVSAAGAAAVLDGAVGRGGLLAALGLIAAGGLVLFNSIPGPVFSITAVMAGGALSGAWCLVLVGAVRRVESPLSTLLATAACFIAALATGGLAPNVGVASVDAALMQPRPRVNLQSVSPALVPLVDAVRSGSDPFRVAPLSTVMFPGTQAYWGLEGIGGADALPLPLVEELSDLSGVERTSWIWLTQLHAGNLHLARGYLDMLNVRYIVARADNLPGGLTVLPLAGDDQIRVLERATAWPRAFFVDGVERHQSVQAFAERLRHATTPFASVVSIDRAATEATAALPRQATYVTAARNYRLTANTTSMTVDTPGPGVLVLSEAFVPGDFQAALNGSPTPYFRANHALRGVLIPRAGAWEVSFVYRPAAWRLAWMLAAAGVALMAGLGVYGRVRSTPRLLRADQGNRARTNGSQG